MFTVWQSFNCNLSIQVTRKRQRCTIILLGSALCGDGHFLPIEERERKAARVCNFIGDLIIASCFVSAVACSYNGFVELPASDWCACKRIVVSNLLYLCIRISNRIAVHVNEIDCNLGIFEAGIVECEYVRFSICCQNQRLLYFIRIELDAL